MTNRCTEAEFQSLKERVARMNSEPDALRHYLAEMSTSPATVRGGLGLARVRFEAQLALSVSRSGGRVTVHASGALRAPALIPGGSNV